MVIELVWGLVTQGLVGRLENESTDQIQGIAPVPLRVRPEPRRPSEIIAVPLLLVANSHGVGGRNYSVMICQ